MHGTQSVFLSFTNSICNRLWDDVGVLLSNGNDHKLFKTQAGFFVDRYTSDQLNYVSPKLDLTTRGFFVAVFLNDIISNIHVLLERSNRIFCRGWCCIQSENYEQYVTQEDIDDDVCTQVPVGRESFTGFPAIASNYHHNYKVDSWEGMSRVCVPTLPHTAR